MIRCCCFLPRVLLRLTPVFLLCAPSFAQAQVRSEARPVRIPYLVGRTHTVASAILARMQFPVAVETACTSDDVGLGMVAYQRPDSGTIVQRPITVTLGVTTYCQRPERILRVPRLVGMQLADARGVLACAQFALGEVSVRDRLDVAAGTVLDQKPAADTEVRVPITVAAPANPPSVAVVVVSDFTLVPRLIGMSEARVRSALQAARLVVGEFRNAPSSATTGTIISQNPPPGTRVQKGTPVSVDVAVVDLVVIPDVRGEHIDRAAQLIANAGLTLGEPSVRDQLDAPARIVLEQSPAPAQTAQRGSRVLVTISSDWTEVPSLEQTHRDDVRAALGRVQLRAGSQSEVPSEANSGLIMRQNPQPGARVLKNTEVAVDVAVPLPPSARLVVVPPLIGMPRDSAMAALQLARLSAGNITLQPAAGASNVVIDQSPRAGNAIMPGSAVDIVVATGADVVVPNVVGLSHADAGALLASSTLALALGGDVRTSDYPAGAVASQFPAAGTLLPANSVITLNLAVAPRQIPWDIILGMLVALVLAAAVVGHTRKRSRLRVAAPRLAYVPRPSTVRVWRVPHDATAHGFSLQLRGMPNSERDRVELRHEFAQNQ